MRKMHGATVVAPSSSLLRFLRSQTENICFSTPNTKQPCLQRAPSLSRQRLLASNVSTRQFSTRTKRQARVESSILNLDFLRIRSKQDSLLPPYQASATRPGTPSPYRIRDGSSRLHYTSNDTRPLLKRLWQLKGRGVESALKPNDLPPLPGFLDDAGGTILGRSAGKASNELKLRCTEFDENGNVTLVNGEFKKAELIAKVYLQMEVLVYNLRC